MFRCLLSTLLVCVLTASAFGNSCSNPKVSSISTFSTQDATILYQLAYIGEFSLKCANDGSPNLFALFPCGRVVPVARVGDDKYQISWIEDIKKSSSGNVAIRLFDEEGYANYRKAQRDGDKAADVKSLIDITLTTKGAYKGPWVNAELLAAIVVGSIAYFALTTKNKIQA